VFGVWVPGEPVANLVYCGLYALQHRGQESAGMAVGDGQSLLVRKEIGLVSQVLDEPTLATLQGHLAIGHTRCTACVTGSYPVPMPDAAVADLRPSATAQPPTLPLPNP
jgi:glutamine phosphoribosylpyrophosphate amidotransferase